MSGVKKFLTTRLYQLVVLDSGIGKLNGSSGTNLTSVSNKLFLNVGKSLRMWLTIDLISPV